MDLSNAFEYAAPVLRRTDGLKMHFLPVPPEVATALKEAGSKRVVGTLNGVRFRRALHGSGGGDVQFLLGQNVLKEIGASYGDTVEVVVMPDPNPDHVNVPPELIAVLALDDEARERWEGWTPGRQRSAVIYVTQAKRSATREKRALELAYKMRTYTLYDDPPR